MKINQQAHFSKASAYSKMFRLRRAERIVLLPVVAFMVTSCTTNMGVRHSPLHPANNVAVDFRIKASDADCIKEARLYIYEYETYVSDKGMQSARKRDGGTWGLVKTWSYSMHPKDINESYCKKGGFPAHSYVTYVFSVTDKKGNVACESWSFAAGDWQFGTSPIPLLGNGAPASRIDVCFVADRDDYASARAMLGDLEKLIFDGYHINNGVKRGKKYWQFYYSPERGNITDFDASPRSMEIPGSVSSSSIIDHAAIIHTTVLRDWASGGNFGTEPTNIGTAVHESGHAAFNLKDEYNGGGHSTSTNPHHNNYNSLSSCQTYNTNNGWPASDCENIQSGWWRPEPASLKCIMWDDGDASMPSFQRTCLARIDWFYSNL